MFGIKCAACHGIDSDGNGPAALFLETPPRDFTKGVSKFLTTVQDGMPADMDVFPSTKAGFMAHGMPSFRSLLALKRWSLVHHVKSLYPKWERFGEPEQITVPAEPAGAVARGKQLYQENYACAQCHGPSGHGDGDRSGDLQDQWNRPLSPRNFAIGASYLKMGWRKRDTVVCWPWGFWARRCPATSINSRTRRNSGSSGT